MWSICGKSVVFAHGVATTRQGTLAFELNRVVAMSRCWCVPDARIPAASASTQGFAYSELEDGMLCDLPRCHALATKNGTRVLLHSK
jgi:hypothetical protein